LFVVQYIVPFLVSDVGNASDNQDLASEAASNHSASSLELENDNLSDMVSANVSGRGSPNISGKKMSKLFCVCLFLRFPAYYIKKELIMFSTVVLHCGKFYDLTGTRTTHIQI
jgi:hypothetical protein